MATINTELESLLGRVDRLSPTEFSRLAVLRHQLGQQLLETTSPSTPAIPSTDIFAGKTGIPEIDRSALTGAHIESGLHYHGALVVRNMISQEDVANLAGLIDENFSSEQQYPLDEQSKPLDGGAPMQCSPTSLQGLINAYQNSDIKPVFEDYLGEPPVLLSERVLLDRKVMKFGLPWHQDGAFFGANARAINSFLALDDCGTDAPGLSLVAKRFNEVYGVEEGARAELSYGGGITEEKIRSLAGSSDAIVTPVLRAGDCILLDELTFHRTSTCAAKQSKPGSFRRRIEDIFRISRPEARARTWAVTWFFAPSRFPAERHPLWFY